MSTSKDYLNYILDQLSEVDGVTFRPMMGEYIIYIDGKIAAYVCDDRLLVKPLPAAERLMPDAKREPPYEGAKDMLLVENIDDRAFLKTLFTAIYPDLPMPKHKKK
ncbi:MAG: TfoX/Sxy family protein [Clostridia bacterium]|nr:TfoX/Sxy family protein [Clostridia bacterium]